MFHPTKTISGLKKCKKKKRFIKNVFLENTVDCQSRQRESFFFFNVWSFVHPFSFFWIVFNAYVYFSTASWSVWSEMWLLFTFIQGQIEESHTFVAISAHPFCGKVWPDCLWCALRLLASVISINYTVYHSINHVMCPWVVTLKMHSVSVFIFLVSHHHPTLHFGMAIF